MSPISLRNFRQTQTTLDLNGPTLSFEAVPTPQSGYVGQTETFVGIVTATFPQEDRATNTGIVSYRWYEGSIPLSDGNGLTGTATSTLTVSSVSSPEDNGRVFVLRAEYIPSAYETGVTGNAYNSPIISDDAQLTVWPEVTITTQPVSQSVGIDNEATFSVVAELTDSSYGPIQYIWTLDGQQVAGNSSSITLTATQVGIQTVQCQAYVNSGGGVRGEFSDVVNLETEALKKKLRFEAFDSDNDIKSEEIDLEETTSYTLTSSTFGSTYNVITVFAPEQDITVEMLMKASAGRSYTGTAQPGEGGVSTIRLPLVANVEHTIIGVAGNSAIFLYRGSVLVAVVGQGGDEANSNEGTTNGGAGGGVNVAGQDSSGYSGGSLIPPGNLTNNGVWGSIVADSNISLQQGDTIATNNNGGQTISCTKGSYWVNQGVSVCANNSTSRIRYYGVDGTEVTSSSNLFRGFKPGYSISNTSGNGRYGRGGNGATGGQGSDDFRNGAGGGSGYTNGEIEIINTQLGGNTTQVSSITFSLV